MNVTPGELLFYGGLAGMAAVLIVGLIAAIVLTTSRKRMRKKLTEEYGGKFN